MKPALLQEIIDKIKSVRIAVIGDFCLDSYWFIDESRSEISIETGHPTKPVRQQKYSLGGAGNVVNNLAAMEAGDIVAFGVTGSDPFGEEMLSIMKRAGIDTRNMIIQGENWATHVYIKPISGEREQNRIDFGNYNILTNETADLLINNLEKEAPEVDIIIINQQVVSGIHTEYLRQKLVELISRFPEKIFIADSRNYTDHYKGAFRKMNEAESIRLCGIHKDPEEVISYSEITNAAEKLFERYRKPILITRGSKGSIITDDKGISEISGLMIISRTDTVGAGDSYLAGTAAALAAGFSVETAGEFGTFVAGVTVQKLFQTGTATPAEILEIGRDPDYIYNQEIAEDIRKAKYFEKSDIEIINGKPDNARIRYAIFDNDGTISTLREGWELVMAPMMIKAILGDKFPDAGKSAITRVKARVDELIDMTTGIQTLMQMKLLIGLILDFGFVPEDQIFDELRYKEIYNNDLMQMVRQREEKLLKGELQIEDLTMKNAVPFIRRLVDNGVKLYLTSGTDEADVRHEAAILGYGNLFEDRIYGSVGDLKKEAKKIVVEKILNSIGDSEAGSIVTFGDGPVEIRETHKRGGFTVGIASNELRRYGLNHIKRTRLIKAGADIIVPDFSQSELLLGLINFT